VKQNGQSDKIYYSHKDHLGSIISITDNAGSPVFAASYDAWGKQTITNNTFKYHRGYTGHEHLPEFGLINMNGRMYDPIVGRFLSPDPFVQMPDFSQSYNRYSYCLNNPLIYTDPDGEWIILVAALIGAYLGGSGANSTFNPAKWDWSSGKTWGGMIGGAFQGAFTVMGLQAGFAQMGWNGLAQFGRSEATKGLLTGTIKMANYSNTFAKIGMGTVKTLAVANSASISMNTLATVTSAIANPNNAGQILMGNFSYNPNGSSIWQGISRGSYESIQQNLGSGIGHLRNTFGEVDNVEIFDGVTLINGNYGTGWWGFALGSMINSKNIDVNSDGFWHEFGHTMQSRRWGPLYPFAIGIPSVLSSKFTPSKHDGRWYEKDATYLGNKYWRDYHTPRPRGSGSGGGYFESPHEDRRERMPHHNLTRYLMLY